jgi:SAM-dependent methyltransferase
MERRCREAVSSIFDRRAEGDLRALAEACGFRADAIIADFRVHKAAHRTAQISPGRAGDLERRWYASLESGAPDYSVYSDPFYLVDIWLCWTLYSRKGLLDLANPKSLETRSVIDYFGAVGAVLDLGCGFGYTTAGLKELFPKAQVTGTNLRDSFQFAIAAQLGLEFHFSLVERYERGPVIDVLVASEYFEHFSNPIEHAYEVLKIARPRHLVIANGFNGRAIGHFDAYTHRGTAYPAARMSKMFSEALRVLGYHKVKTKIWNNRPAIWSRS